jgi:hypothetical protein
MSILAEMMSSMQKSKAALAQLADMSQGRGRSFAPASAPAPPTFSTARTHTPASASASARGSSARRWAPPSTPKAPHAALRSWAHESEAGDAQEEWEQEEEFLETGGRSQRGDPYGYAYEEEGGGEEVYSQQEGEEDGGVFLQDEQYFAHASSPRSRGGMGEGIFTRSPDGKERWTPSPAPTSASTSRMGGSRSRKQEPFSPWDRQVNNATGEGRTDPVSSLQAQMQQQRIGLDATLQRSSRVQ